MEPAPESPKPETPPSPRRPLALFHELLSAPLAPVERARSGESSAPLVLLAGGLVGFALYGAAAGFFQGGTQVAIAAWKAPAIALLSLLLCLPSLYVFGALAGARWTPKTFVAVAAGLLATLGLLLAGLLPIGWLFSSSSRYLGMVTWIHVLLWLVALGLAFRFLGGALRALGARGGTFLWLALFALVSFQVATLLRPVLYSKPKEPLLRLGEKKSFFEHLGDAFKVELEEPKPAKPSPPRSPSPNPREAHPPG
ncbi:MAG TPA: hypothetical protein VN783_07730 [Thermoanaerobaculia bacterium]|nr:hypothetical protein [Thermoanaerobaculia bacterium]